MDPLISFVAFTGCCVLLLCFVLSGRGQDAPVPSIFRPLQLGRRLGLRGQVWVQRSEGVIVDGLGQEGEGGQELVAITRQSVYSCLEDVVAFLDQVEFCEVKAAAVVRVGSPGVEVAAVSEIVVD